MGFPFFRSLASRDPHTTCFSVPGKTSQQKSGLKHLKQVLSLHPLLTPFSLRAGGSFKVKNTKSHLLRASFSARMVSSGYTFLSSQILKILSIDLDTEGSLKEKSAFSLTPWRIIEIILHLNQTLPRPFRAGRFAAETRRFPCVGNSDGASLTPYSPGEITTSTATLPKQLLTWMLWGK